MIELPKRPYIAPWYQLVKEQKRMLFKYADNIIVFEGKAAHTLLPELLPLLDGTRTLDEIHECIGEAIQPATLKALELLKEKGLLIEGYQIDVTKPVENVVKFFQSVAIGQDAGAEGILAGAEGILKSIQEAKVGIVGTGIAAEEIARLLKLCGIELINRNSWQDDKQSFRNTDLVIAAPQYRELSLLYDWNKFALNNHKPWMQVIPYDGRFAAVGPLYIPGETACYKCYRMRLVGNVDYREELSDWDRGIEERHIAVSDHPVPPQINLVLSCVASLQVLVFLVRRQSESNLVNCFYAVEFGREGVSLKQHHVYRVPRCPACSRLAMQGSPIPWYSGKAGANE